MGKDKLTYEELEHHCDGRMSHNSAENNDLMMLPEKKEGWINLYNADTTFYYVEGRVYECKDEAIKEANNEIENKRREKGEYVKTIKVEWEDALEVREGPEELISVKCRRTGATRRVEPDKVAISFNDDCGRNFSCIGKCHGMAGKDGSGKDDRADNKPRWELLPLPEMEEVVKVYTMGAEKYSPGSWKDIPDGYERYKAALLRHVTAYDRGERLDKESGLSHLAHAAWNAIAMLYYDLHDKAR